MALSRRAFLGVLGTGLVSALAAACSSPAPAPSPVPTAAPAANAGAPATSVSLPTVAPQPTVAPTVAPTPTAQANPTATTAARRVRIATWTSYHDGAAVDHPLALDVKLAPGKLPPDRAFAVDLVKFDSQASTLNPTSLGPRYAERLTSGALVADLVFADRTVLQPLALANALRDLGPLLAKESWFKKEDFWGNVLQTGQFRGAQLTFPFDASVEIIAYDQSRLLKQGVAEPPLQWTWDDLIATAKSLTGSGKWGLRVSPWSPNVLSLAWQYGATLFGADGTIQVTEPGAIQALEFLDLLFHREQIAPPTDSTDPRWTQNDPFTSFDASQVGSAWTSHYYHLFHGDVATLATQSRLPSYRIWWRENNFLGFSTEIASLPQGEHPAVLGVSSTLVGIPTKAPDPDLSFAALHAFSDASDVYAALPVRKTVTDLRKISKLFTEKDASVLSTSLRVARFLPGDVTWDVLQHLSNDLVLPVLTGQKKPQDAANDAQKLIDADRLTSTNK